MNNYWYDLVGNIGVLLILLCYLLIQLGKLNNDSLVYSLGNLLGAVLTLVSLYFGFNLSVFISCYR
ncbi:CBU_0592 family membrane protein [Spartinivicinus poritis]|uniref:CBU_0592 family membrane protein n=1 Tax=Spartinivicinus poritis TaxID=2994640 RepID=UPI003CC91BDE